MHTLPSTALQIIIGQLANTGKQPLLSSLKTFSQGMIRLQSFAEGRRSMRLLSPRLIYVDSGSLANLLSHVNGSPKAKCSI